jgi:hypothetical protein
MEVFYNLDNNVIVCYNQFDMGKKYKIYKLSKEFNNWEYVDANDSCSLALEYAQKIYHE